MSGVRVVLSAPHDPRGDLLGQTVDALPCLHAQVGVHRAALAPMPRHEYADTSPRVWIRADFDLRFVWSRHSGSR